ncbi:MAG: hypothetical protein ACYS9X_15035 [Planctomycetota bacterium]|jgi:hypothetical protein
MPRDEGGPVRSQKTTDIYSVMLIISMVLLMGAIALTYHELSTHYDFWGSRADVVAVDDDAGGGE